MRNERQTATENGPIDAQSYARAALNILDDFGEERARFNDTQRAILNIFDDFGEERATLNNTQRAVLNILADVSDEKARFDDVQKAIVNIIDDAGVEKLNLEAAQKATLNILEDFDAEKNKVEQMNREMAGEIAERKRAEEQILAANAELESFSYSVSHDLRAPLRHIQGYGEMLAKAAQGQLSDKAERYLKIIVDTGGEMGSLIDELLAFSRMGRVEMREEKVSLDRLVEETIRGSEMATRGRNIVWKVPPLPPVLGDPSMIKQVFANLIGNALKYSSTRDPAEIEVGCDGREAERVVVFVRDNGVGFDMQYADKLFGVFQRLHRAEEFEGTGIGLANARRIVVRHGGRIWAEAALNSGATFYFTIKPSPPE